MLGKTAVGFAIAEYGKLPHCSNILTEVLAWASKDYQPIWQLQIQPTPKCPWLWVYYGIFKIIFGQQEIERNVMSIHLSTNSTSWLQYEHLPLSSLLLSCPYPVLCCIKMFCGFLSSIFFSLNVHKTMKALPLLRMED